MAFQIVQSTFCGYGTPPAEYPACDKLQRPRSGPRSSGSPWKTQTVISRGPKSQTVIPTVGTMKSCRSGGIYSEWSFRAHRCHSERSRGIYSKTAFHPPFYVWTLDFPPAFCYTAVVPPDVRIVPAQQIGLFTQTVITTVEISRYVRFEF